MPCLGPTDIERVTAEGLLSVPGAAEHVAGCADCATTIGAAVRANRKTDAPAEQLGRYQILGERGRGAFGRVFEAYDPALDRRVAVKMIAFTRDAGPDALAELLREAKAMAQIQHANVVPIFDAGRADDAVFITMPIVDGETLDVWAARERRSGIDADRVLASIGRKIAAGLSAIHAAGFVHRDIKPSNILVAGADAFVADLGLARRTTRSTANTDVFSGSELLSSMHTVSFAGTPAYMAPECLGGEAATPASDQYALAATLVEVITGERPFTARTYWALHEAARTNPPRLTGVPKRYHAALSRALHPDPAKRYGSIVDFASALVQARAPSRVGAMIAVVAIVPALVVGAGWWWSTRESSTASERDVATASIERDGATVSNERDGATVSNERDGATTSVERDAVSTRDAASARDVGVVAVAPTTPIAAAVIDAAVGGAPINAAAGGAAIDASVGGVSINVDAGVGGAPIAVRGDAAIVAPNQTARDASVSVEQKRKTPVVREPVDASGAPDAPEPARPIVDDSPRSCASAEECRTTWMRCKSVAAAKLTPLDQTRKRGWDACSAANNACKTNNGVTCAGELTRCNTAVAADYERGNERVQQETDRCLDARNECLACK